MELKDKFILDACCGGRMMWFNKHHPNALYIDIRKEEKGIIYDRPNFEVNPDIVMDFRALDFKDKSFKLVVMDPPHFISLSKKSWVAKKYGVLERENATSDLKKGFAEAWRVLDDYGVLVVKWSIEAGSRSIPEKVLLSLLPSQPLFGHTTGTKSNTKWFCLMKIPGEVN